MLRRVIIYKSSAGYNLELATDVDGVNTRVLDLLDSWASRHLETFPRVYVLYCLYRTEPSFFFFSSFWKTELLGQTSCNC